MVSELARVWLFTNSQGGVSRFLRPQHSRAQHNWRQVACPVFVPGSSLDQSVNIIQVGYECIRSKCQDTTCGGNVQIDTWQYGGTIPDILNPRIPHCRVGTLGCTPYVRNWRSSGVPRIRAIRGMLCRSLTRPTCTKTIRAATCSLGPKTCAR